MWRGSGPVPRWPAQMQSFVMIRIVVLLRIWKLGSEEKLKRMSCRAFATDCLVEKRKWVNSWKKAAQTLVFMGDCSYLNIWWKDNRIGWKQLRGFLKCVVDSFNADAGQTVCGKVLCCMCYSQVWKNWLDISRLLATLVVEFEISRKLRKQVAYWKQFLNGGN